MPTEPEIPDINELGHRATRVWGLACAADFLRCETDQRQASEGFAAVMLTLVEESDRLAKALEDFEFTQRTGGRS